MFNIIADKARSIVSVPDSVEQNWAKCEDFIVSAVADAYNDNIRSDDGFSGVMESVYEVLPLPLRLILSRDKFISMSLSQRDMLVDKATVFRQSRLPVHADTLALPEAIGESTLVTAG